MIEIVNIHEGGMLQYFQNPPEGYTYAHCCKNEYTKLIERKLFALVA